MIMSNNNFYLFNRKYYITDRVSDLISINEELYNSEIVSINSVYENNPHIIPLKTTYPGLLIGSGYGHDYKHEDDTMKKEAFKIGFHFDFTTGMPIIPGSSVKGLLRSCFPQKSVKTKHFSDEFRENRRNFIRHVLRCNLEITCTFDVDALDDEIFHGKRDGKPIPIYERDVFFDAVPVSVNNTKVCLFDSDYITPHIQDGLTYEMSMLKNPEPLKFLKVSPSVIYRFEFRFFNSQVCFELTAEKKMKLFEYLILTLGLGAKTNVGYGQFEKTFAIETDTSYLPIENFNPIKIEENKNIEDTTKKKNFSDDTKSEKRKEEEILKQEQNKEFKEQRKESLEKLSTVIEVNKPYVGKVVELIPDNDTYKINLKEVNITVNRKIIKEAKKGIMISLNKEYLITFITIKEPFVFTVSEKYT